ncbi:MAG: hypothetical protein IJC25_06115 [Clostridia bacterium]|nr:hypothetical protein [Clostridia bacterium]
MKKRRKAAVEEQEEKVVRMDEEQRRKKRRRIRLRRLATICAVMLIIAFIAVNWEWTSPAAIARRIRISRENRGAVGEYPLDLTQENPLLIFGIEKGGLLLTNSGYYTLTEDGTAHFLHTYNRPTANIFDSCAVLYSQGGEDYVVQSSNGKLYSANAGDPILSASCAPNGAVALLTKPSAFTTRLTVISAARKELFAQTFRDNSVSSVALSRNVRRIAAARSTTVSGQLSSTVEIYDISKQDPVARLELGDQMVLGMSFSRNGGLMVLCDRAVFFYNADYEQMLCYTYAGSLQAFRYSADGYLALLVDSGSQEGGQRLAVFRTGSLLFEQSVPVQASCVAVYNGKTAYYCDGTVSVCDNSGAVIGSVQAVDAQGLCLTSESLLVLTKDSLVRYRISDLQPAA